MLTVWEEILHSHRFAKKRVEILVISLYSIFLTEYAIVFVHLWLFKLVRYTAEYFLLLLVLSLFRGPHTFQL